MRITEVFTSIQGEGANTGIPMHFVRFAGCNLRCEGCDTPTAQDVEDGKIWMPIDVIGEINKKTCPDVKWVCFTGGEPALQFREWQELARMLKERDYKLAMETNGTLWMPLSWVNAFEWLCVSPKTDNVRELPLIASASEVKLLLNHPSTFSTFTELGEVLRDVRELNPSAIVSIQPWLKENEQADPSTISLAVACAKRFGLRLSLQTHKMIGVP